MRRRRCALGGIAIGPQTRRLQAVRDGIKGVRRALDRGACRDAAVLLELTEREARRLKAIGATERDGLADERARLNRACRARR